MINNPKTSRIMLKDLQNAATIVMLLTLTACTTLASVQKWPSDLPERDIFVDEFLSDRQLRPSDADEIEAHLIWIVRFYQGTILYPNGWTRASERFVASIKKQRHKRKMSARLRSLGILIANEWAKDNDVRRINNTSVAIWGSALRTSAARDDQFNYISKVERDVEELIAGTLLPTEISYQRYYPSEDYDDF